MDDDEVFVGIGASFLDEAQFRHLDDNVLLADAEEVANAQDNGLAIPEARL